jgi:hypothetical protein
MLSVKEKIEKAEDYKGQGSALVQKQKYKRAIAKYSTVFAYIKVCCSSVRGVVESGKVSCCRIPFILIVEGRLENDTENDTGRI